MISYIKYFLISTLMCTSFNGITAYPSSSTDIHLAVDQKINQVIDQLNLVEGREINLTAAAVTGLLFIVNARTNETGGAVCSLCICLYNLYRALHKTSVLNNLEDVKRIVHRHITHLHGYVR